MMTTCSHHFDLRKQADKNKVEYPLATEVLVEMSLVRRS